MKRRSEVGYETMGGKKIPYVRRVYPADYAVTTYGSQDASDHVKGITFLVKHVRRGAISWGTVVGDVRILMTGRVTNKLQGLLETPEGNELFHAVLYARQVPEALTDITQLSYPKGAGRSILAAVQHAIVSGNPNTIKMLVKCVEGAALYGNDPLPDKLNEKIVEALRVSANGLGRIPTKQEVQREYESGRRDIEDERNFSKRLRQVGLDWLPTRR